MEQESHAIDRYAFYSNLKEGASKTEIISRRVREDTQVLKLTFTVQRMSREKGVSIMLISLGVYELTREDTLFICLANFESEAIKVAEVFREIRIALRKVQKVEGALLMIRDKLQGLVIYRGYV